MNYYTMKKMLLLLCMTACICISGQAQESNHGKDTGADKELINQKMPPIVIKEWISEIPDTTGKFILIDFWGTWCYWCVQEIPHLNEIAKEFKDDLVVIGVANQTAKDVKKMKKPVIEYYSAADSTSTTINECWIDSFPHCKLLAPDKTVIWEGIPKLPGFELTKDTIRLLIDKYKKLSSPAKENKTIRKHEQTRK